MGLEANWMSLWWMGGDLQDKALERLFLGGRLPTPQERAKLVRDGFGPTDQHWAQEEQIAVAAEQLRRCIAICLLSSDGAEAGMQVYAPTTGQAERDPLGMKLKGGHFTRLEVRQGVRLGADVDLQTLVRVGP